MKGHANRPVPHTIASGAALALLLSCSPSPRPPGAVVDAMVKDFAILAPATVDGGDVAFRVTNEGPTTHEFVLVRTDLLADDLPIGPDGLSAEEEGLRILGEIGEVGAGTTEMLAVHLDAGNHVLFCNLEGHYLGGMYMELVVAR